MTTKSPYANFDPTSGEETIDTPVAPAPIESDRGEPVTKSPKKRKPMLIVAIAAICISMIAIVVFAGVFAARTLKSSGKTPDVPVDASTEVVTANGKDYDAYVEKVRKDLDAKKAEEARLAAQANEAGKSKKTGDTTSTNSPNLGNYGNENTSGNTGRSNSGHTSAGGSDEQVKTPAQLAAERRLSDDVMYTAASTGGGASRSGAVTGPGSTSMSKDSTLNDSMTAEVYANGTARRRASLKYLLIHGTQIPCVLVPRIVTNYPGNVQCMITKDVFSADGYTKLINRGAMAFGERKVAMKNGIGKVFVSWGDIENKDGVAININSVAVDTLGATGLDAEIDNHWGMRFGGAIALSFLDDAFGALAKSASGSEAEFDNSTTNASDMASKALDSTLNIEPTGYVKHGTELNIMLTRDIDMSNIYATE